MGGDSHAHDGWIGASLLRKEDARHLAGKAMFVADVRLPGMQDIAFVRSQIAHGRLSHVGKPSGAEHDVYTIDDFESLNVLEAGPELDAFRQSPYPALASGKVHCHPSRPGADERSPPVSPAHARAPKISRSA